VSRCGCAGACTCVFDAGRGVILSGTGSQADPIRVSKSGGQAYIQGAATDSIAATVTGTGTVADPFVVAMTRWATANPTPTYFLFEVPGSYVFDKPIFGTLFEIYAVGGGGGGGGASIGTFANQAAADANARRGLGGAPGGFVRHTLIKAPFPASIPVTVGSGGVGGTGGTGAAGAAGTASIVGDASYGKVVAPGGAGGLSVIQGAVAAASPIPGAGGAGGAYRFTPGSLSNGLVGGNAPGTPLAGGSLGAGSSTTVPKDGGGGADPAPVLQIRGSGGGGGGGAYPPTPSLRGGYGGPGGPGAGGGGGAPGAGGIGSANGSAGGYGGDGVVAIVIQ
jgi:hypothetical protein